MTKTTAISFAAFQAVWLVTAFTAAAGLAWPGVCACALFIGYRLASEHGRFGSLLPAAAMSVCGMIAETLLSMSGLMTYAAHWPSGSLAPLWLVALWAAFGMTARLVRDLLGANHSLRYALAGLIAGPASYAAGAWIGALQPQEPLLLTYGLIAAIWAFAMPAMMALLPRSEPTD